MEKSISAYIRQFIEMRVWDISNRMVENKEYKKISKQGKELYGKINDALPEQYKCMLEEYGEMESCRQGLAEGIMFEQGLCEGLRIGVLISTDRV